jgi:hypothetical protein
MAKRLIHPELSYSNAQNIGSKVDIWGRVHRIIRCEDKTDYRLVLVKDSRGKPHNFRVAEISWNIPRVMLTGTRITSF